jgi:hypothetical protein
MTLSRHELEKRLSALEARVPSLMVDMNMFFREFEDAGDVIHAHAAPEDLEYVEAELLRIVQRAGVTPKDIAP